MTNILVINFFIRRMVRMVNGGRFHIPALFSRDFFAEGFTVMPNILIKYSDRLGLEGTDLLILLAIFYFQQTGQYELEIADFSQLLHIQERQIQVSIEKMRDLGLLTDIDQSLETTGLFEKVADLWAEERMRAVQQKQQEAAITVQLKAGKEQLLSPLINIINLFEREFGRALTPIEIDQIKNWYCEHGYAETLIKEALKRAVLRGILNLNYMDKILASWAKMNIRTTREVIQYEERFQDKKKRKEQSDPDQKIAKEQDEKFKDIYLT
ncbi:MAG: DnaD domain protein [Syntrophaceticus schinkii]